MSKIADLRARLPEIAAHRLRGVTWPEIASRLTETGLEISADELRPYWARLAGKRQPAEILLEVVEARAEEAEQRADKSKKSADAHLEAMRNFGPLIGELNGLRKQVSKLQARNAELEANAARTTEAERRAVEAAAGKADEIEVLRRHVGDLQARNAELEADLKAIDIMGLGVGVGRRSKRSLARHSEGR